MENLTELGSKIWTTDGLIQAQHCTTTNQKLWSLSLSSCFMIADIQYRVLGVLGLISLEIFIIFFQNISSNCLNVSFINPNYKFLTYRTWIGSFNVIKKVIQKCSHYPKWANQIESQFYSPLDSRVGSVFEFFLSPIWSQ